MEALQFWHAMQSSGYTSLCHMADSEEPHDVPTMHAVKTRQHAGFLVMESGTWFYTMQSSHQTQQHGRRS